MVLNKRVHGRQFVIAQASLSLWATRWAEKSNAHFDYVRPTLRRAYHVLAQWSMAMQKHVCIITLCQFLRSGLKDCAAPRVVASEYYLNRDPPPRNTPSERDQTSSKRLTDVTRDVKRSQSFERRPPKTSDAEFTAVQPEANGPNPLANSRQSTQ